MSFIEISQFVPHNFQEHLSQDELKYLIGVFNRFNGYPAQEDLWALMDEQWVSLQCDPLKMDERINKFYKHPVWMLNGLFIEQDAVCLAHRRAFTEWIVRLAPSRVADFGGGFGSLARLVGQALPEAQVEVVEPHPAPLAMAMAANTPNVRFVSRLTEQYDVLIATDVFEHVPDPLGLCADTASHLKDGGHFLIANCFQPLIKCHLPQLFHLDYSWDASIGAMGLKLRDRVQYGRAYQRNGPLQLQSARKMEVLALRLYPLIRNLPMARVRIGRLTMKLLSKAF